MKIMANKRIWGVMSNTGGAEVEKLVIDEEYSTRDLHAVCANCGDQFGNHTGPQAICRGSHSFAPAVALTEVVQAKRIAELEAQLAQRDAAEGKVYGKGNGGNFRLLVRNLRLIAEAKEKEVCHACGRKLANRTREDAHE
jgi:hypothetical protein